MKTIYTLVAVSLLTAGLPAVASPASAEQLSESTSEAPDRLLDDAPALEGDHAHETNSDGWVVPEDVEQDDLLQMHVASAAAIGGAAAGILGVGGMALYVQAGGVAFLLSYGSKSRPTATMVMAMFYGAPLAFGALTIASAALAGALTWAFSDAGIGGALAAGIAAGGAVLVGVPLAALGVVLASLLAFEVGTDLLPMSMAAPAVSVGLLVAGVLPVAAVAAGVAGVTTVAGLGGDALEELVAGPRE